MASETLFEASPDWAARSPVWETLSDTSFALPEAPDTEPEPHFAVRQDARVEGAHVLHISAAAPLGRLQTHRISGLRAPPPGQPPFGFLFVQVCLEAASSDARGPGRAAPGVDLSALAAQRGGGGLSRSPSLGLRIGGPAPMAAVRLPAPAGTADEVEDDLDEDDDDEGVEEEFWMAVSFACRDGRVRRLELSTAFEARVRTAGVAHEPLPPLARGTFFNLCLDCKELVSACFPGGADFAHVAGLSIGRACSVRAVVSGEHAPHDDSGDAELFGWLQPHAVCRPLPRVLALPQTLRHVPTHLIATHKYDAVLRTVTARLLSEQHQWHQEQEQEQEQEEEQFRLEQERHHQQRQHEQQQHEQVQREHLLLQRQQEQRELQHHLEQRQHQQQRQQQRQRPWKRPADDIDQQVRDLARPQQQQRKSVQFQLQLGTAALPESPRSSASPSLSSFSGLSRARTNSLVLLAENLAPTSSRSAGTPSHEAPGLAPELHAMLFGRHDQQQQQQPPPVPQRRATAPLQVTPPAHQLETQYDRVEVPGPSFARGWVDEDSPPLSPMPPPSRRRSLDNPGSPTVSDSHFRGFSSRATPPSASPPPPASASAPRMTLRGRASQPSPEAAAEAETPASDEDDVDMFEDDAESFFSGSSGSAGRFGDGASSPSSPQAVVSSTLLALARDPSF